MEMRNPPVRFTLVQCVSLIANSALSGAITAVGIYSLIESINTLAIMRFCQDEQASPDQCDLMIYMALFALPRARILIPTMGAQLGVIYRLAVLCGLM